MTRVTALVLRRLRAPLLALIASYTVSVLGFVLIPGLDDQGNPWRMDFLSAFYVVTYTATTIGFGELPYLFTPGQRLWMTFSVYITVITWFYTLGNIVALVQDAALQRAFRETRFTRAVLRLREPFYLVCGYGDTGSLLVRSLVERGLQTVVVDVDPDRISALRVDALGVDVPGLAADAAVPEYLVRGGLKHPRCAGVLALTNRDEVNLMVAITAKLLAPKTPVICRAETEEAASNMASFGTDFIVNPFEAFAERLAMALYSPETHVLFEWLTGVPRARLEPVIYPPHGTWILCGYGRFGKALRRRLEGEGVTTVIIEAEPEKTRCTDCVRGRGTEAATLIEAGVGKAAGIVAGTDDDANNLSILMTAQALNRKLFLVARQNRTANDEVFEAARTDLVMQRGLIMGHEILALITTPLLSRFLALARRQPREWAEALVDRLASQLGAVVPDLWSVALTSQSSPALIEALRNGTDLRLTHLVRDPRDRDQELAAIPLLLARDGYDELLPDPQSRLHVGDEVLLAGAWDVPAQMSWTRNHCTTLAYVLTGEKVASGHVWRWITGASRRRSC
ncbi:MAG: NAD-binding protein [Gammaproteobacteria bacterium]|nr:NAD-binding protein [Gammaproteobacteria bacterium]